MGFLTIADQIKADASHAVDTAETAWSTTMLSGDKTAVVKSVADKLHIERYFGDLLPEDKVTHLKTIKDQPSNKANKKQTVAFVEMGE